MIQTIFKSDRYRKLARALFIPALAVPILLASYGCGTDVLTYAGDSKKEGLKQFNDGNYPEAAGSFRNATRQDPTDPETEYWLGRSYEASGDNHQAVDSYKTALKLMPAPGTTHYSEKLHEDCFDRLARVVAKADPTGSEIDLILQDAYKDRSSEGYRLAARVFEYRGDADTALDNFNHAVRLNPKNFAAQKEMGLYLEQLNQNQRAADALRDAYRLNQKDAQVNDGLRKIGLVPGPGLLAQDQLAKPLLPNGPIPDLVPTPAAHSVSPAPVDSQAQPRD